jgi:peptidoglycan/LPS O-acetylase OafA/YrhL
MLDRRPSAFTPWQLPLVSVFSLLLLIFLLIPVRGFRGVTVNEWILYSLAWVAIPVLFMTSRKSRVDRYVGEFSYGIYVIHYPVIWLVRLYTTHAICLYVLALSIGLALVINHFVATPIERIRQKRSAKARQRSPMLVGAAG